jgi:Binding-protein-dependent transport system inner membrane component
LRRISNSGYRGARVSAAAIVDRSPTNPSTAASSKRVSIVQRNTNKNYLTPHEKERQITENVINCLGRSSQLGGPEHQSQYGQLSEGVHRRSPGARLTICSRSAHVDGCSPLGTFLRITFPLTMPGIIATGLLSFIFAWNEFLFANVLTGAGTRTAPVGLTEYVTPVSVEWNNIMAAGTVVVLPVWIGALAAQRYLVRGLTLGAVK